MSVQSLLSQALSAYQSRDLATAHRWCQQILREASDNPYALHLQAVLYLDQGQLSVAQTWVQKALAAKPDLADAHNTLGVIAERRGQTEQALRAFQQSACLYPNNADVQKNLGMALVNTGQIERAEEAIQKALQLNPNHAAALNVLGLIRMKQRQFEAAQKAYEEAIAHSPKYIDAHYNLAWLMEQQNQLQAAQAGYEKVLVLKPDHFKAHHALSGLKRSIASDPAFVQLEQLKTRRSLTPRECADLYFTLGKMYADVENYHAAFHHYRCANDAWRRLISYDADAHRRRIEALIEATPQSVFNAYIQKHVQRQDAPRGGESSHRPVFIVGMPRSGTTLVEQILASHPEVYGAGELTAMGELSNHWLSQCSGLEEAVQTLTSDQRQNYAGQYLQALEQRNADAARVIDKMPDNFQALWFIALLFPNARVIHLKRHPLDNCVACYTTHFFAGHSYTSDLQDLGQYYSDYHRLMCHWCEVLPMAILEVEYERLVEDVETYSRAMVDFLGLPWDDACLDFYANPRSVSTASSVQVRRPIYRSSVGRWKRYEEHLGALVRSLQHLL